MKEEIAREQMDWAEVMAEVEAGRETPSLPLEPPQLLAALPIGALGTKNQNLRTRSRRGLLKLRTAQTHPQALAQEDRATLTATHALKKTLGATKEALLTSPRRNAVEDINLTERQKKQALRAYKFKVGKLNQPITAKEERSAIIKKLDLICKQVQKIESKLKHKTSERKQPRRTKKNKEKVKESNHPASEMRNFETDSQKVPKHLRERSLMETARLLVATELLIDNPPEILTEEYLLGTTYDEYEERVHFIEESRASKGKHSGMINSPLGNFSCLKYIKKCVEGPSAAFSSSDESECNWE